MKIMIPLVFILALAFSSAQPVETVGGSMGCQTEQDYESLAQLRANADQGGIDQLMENRKCQVLEADLPVSVIEMTETRARIRVFRNKSSQVLWTDREAVKNLPQ